MFHSILGSYFGEKRAAPGAGVVEGHSDDSGAAVSLLEGKAGGAGPVGSVAYRLLPDISRHLWDPNGGLEEESFHATMRCGWIHLVAEGPIPGEGVSPEEELKRDVICQGEAEQVHPVTTAGGSEHGRGVRGEDVGILRRRCGWIHLVAEGPIPGEGVSPEEELKRDVICQGEAEQEVMVDVSSQGKRRKSSPKPLVLSEAKKQLLIYRLPQVLRLHLKRLRRSERNHREKMGVRVLFEQVLNVEPYCCRDSLPSLATETFVYDLSAVVMHHGKGFGSGHYTAYCYNTEGGFWVHCNDSKLNVCSVEEVCKTQAYILFYTQRTLQDKAGIPEKQLQAQVFATQNQ
ncbi:hypothetical protein DUI87_15225 [Hirundo rustica rustica]|uniref:USP domain-containing protein n=1 Tax=Hirundo rustica rustica TaxID=333673 RepID=A0A3M0K3K9_HIRRU|nr:hypothetical protein DUI87_15225 [Hirundo rustica rustica]